jgi:arylsulfatase
MSNTPFRKFKSFLYEGGISTPLIVHWPAGLKTKPGALDSTPGYLPDIMATVVEASGAPYPKEFQGHAITPLEGRSLMPILSATPMPAPPRLICWEQYGFKAVREGDLKAVFITDKMYDKSGSNTWELYDIAKDRLEQHNLAKERPAELQELIAKWEAWAKRARVQDAPDTKGK